MKTYSCPREQRLKAFMWALLKPPEPSQHYCIQGFKGRP